MFRFRRYRVFLISAFLITVALVRFSRNREWESISVGPGVLHNGEHAGHFDPKGHSPLKSKASSPIVDIEHFAHSSEPSKLSKPTINNPPPKLRTKEPSAKEAVSSPKSSAILTDTNADPKSVPKIVLPDRRPARLSDLYDVGEDEASDEIHMQFPSRVEPILLTPSPEPIYWVKQQEHFPVPTESIIQLPTGETKSIPKIQHKFSEETADARKKREERQQKVKDEFTRAWNGYKKNAWMHDELSPVSGESRDPFGGWAATLVDSLDTLWIMGLEEEFAEAVRSVSTIDFTTCARPDIPVFETTIRYLGGLLAAFDVSGQVYKTLLDKAVELAEVLMGAFDTPNRMPNLFYRWKPAFASQPHRANTRSNLAELGSLAMEFTHLAQLTKEAKYYDAVARITDALEEYQNRGTKLGGIFPETIDASGCNRSAPIIKHSLSTKEPAMILDHSLSAEGKGYEAPMPKIVKEPKQPREEASSQAADLELSVIPGEPSKGHLRIVEDELDELDSSKGSAKIVKRTESETILSNSFTEPVQDAANKNAAKTLPRLPQPLEDPDDPFGDWDCVPQGLNSASGSGGRDTFSMGAAQDSTYEYFSKQYILLGGLEDKYRTMYLKTMDAVRNHLLYRPMVPDGRDILFSGKVTTAGHPDTDLMFQSEVTHLTCFLGGMVGMGAKLFGLDSDIEIAKKLADGCVWAYESMKSGIMPEMGEVIACKSVTDCPWNETMWHEALDPMAGQRDLIVKNYYSNKAKLLAQQEADRLAKGSELAAEEKYKAEAAGADRLEDPTSKFDSEDVIINADPLVSTNSERGNGRAASKTSLRTRDLQEVPRPSTHKFSDDISSSKSKSPPPILDHEDRYQKKLKDMENELLLSAPGRKIEDSPLKRSQVPTPSKTVDPNRPQTHKEFVKSTIEREDIAPGFVYIPYDKYILRPEAIESVWYMYRITGDPIWQERGWVMFQSIINATQTTHGHSAVIGVTKDHPKQINKMESFWLAETLKYFYLLYSTPDVISLDEWVLNTEAHPFKRPK